MELKIVIDTSSLINFFKYYRFDKSEKDSVYSKLRNFLKDKITQGEIIIIDRVYEEINDYVRGELVNLKKEIKGYQVKTDYLVSEVEGLIEQYTIVLDPKVFKKQTQIEVEIDKIRKSADLYLIEYTRKLKKEGYNAILITEETKFHNDGKALPKIPEICQKEGITCKTLPFALFKVYKEELLFSLNIKK